MINIDITMAIPKLKSVPNKMYSVSFRSLDSFKSPNLNTDFAANKNPTASHLLDTINIKTKDRSNIPIHFPALSSESSSASPMRSDQGISVF